MFCGPTSREARQISSHVRLARVRRREAALEQRALRRERNLVGDRDLLRGELRVGHHDIAHARLDRACDEREDLIAREVPGRQHHVVARDHAEDRDARRRRAAPSASTHGHRLRVQARLAQLELEGDPDGRARAGRRRVHLVLLVDRVDGREPDGAGALARGDLDGERIEPADRPVERDRAEDAVRRRPPTRRPGRAPPSRCSATSAGSRRAPAPGSAARARRRRSCARRRRGRCARACRTRRGRGRGRVRWAGSRRHRTPRGGLVTAR